MFTWIDNIPTGSGLLLFASAFVGVTWIGIVALRLLARRAGRAQPRLNDLVGYVISCYCVFYGLLLGLLAVVTYQNFDAADSAISREASALAVLYRNVSDYPEPARDELRSLLRDYCRFVIDEEWPLQEQGITPGDGETTHMRIFHQKLVAFQPQTKSQELLHAETLSQYSHYYELRRLSLVTVGTKIPAVLWHVVGLGALINIVLIWCFDMKLPIHLLLGGLLSFFIGAIIFLISVMDTPYRGEVSVPPDAFRAVLDGVMIPEAPP
jgi:hypothetical protein